jgi:hypothetical protein
MCNIISGAIKLEDTKTLINNKADMILFIQSISGKLPNIKFFSRAIEMIELCLVALLKVHGDDNKGRMTNSSSEINNVLHKFNIGIITSLTVGAVPPQPIGKKQKSSSSTPPGSEYIDIALSVDEMSDLLFFYLSYLLVVSLLSGIPLKATKFDDLSKIHWNWIERDRSVLESPKTWKRIIELIESCCQSHQGPWSCFAFVEAACNRITSNVPPSDELVNSVIAKLTTEYLFANEFGNFVSKYSFVNERILHALRDALSGKDNVPHNILQSIGEPVRNEEAY